MAYRLKVHESFSGGIKRVATEELGEALRSLRGEPAPDNRDPVHDARKRFKKVRATLRLIRRDLGRKRYRKTNLILRDAGRELSGLRDAVVLVGTLEALAEHVGDKAPRGAFEGAREALLARQRRLGARAGDLSAVAEKVAGLQGEVAGWPVGDTWNAVRPNLDRTYRRGLEAFGEAYRHPSDDGFHEWRKGVKDLWYHLRILNPLWPDVMEALAAQAGELADLLGNEHDLAVLAQTLAADPGAFGGAKDVGTLLGLIEDYRRDLRAAARLLGRRVYADKPKGFVARFESYWQAWRAEA